ncbi:MAG TPA: hypothetical protein VEZ43_00310, partial [Dongiaceae bacterium]|nr:hypothetical protein [Dongiaceae bacterium]
LRLDKLWIRPFNHPEPADLATIRPLRGLLTGLIGSDEMLLGISRLLGVKGKRISLETKILEENPSVIELGAVRLSPEYEETGYSHM